MAACDDKLLLIGALADGELDAANTALAEAHVARCEACRDELERLEAVRRLMHTDGVRHSAPDALRRRIGAMPELAPKAANENRWPGWVASGAVGALAASLAMVSFVPSTTTAALDQDIVSSHVRSLQPGHLMDVQTTNQHIVKPWFNGRIDFAPPVPELAAAGFPLAGGRLDSVDGKTVAAIVYKRRLHTVNLYVWPEKEANARAFTKDGFSVREWSRSGLRFAAISDIPSGELEQFQQLFVKAS
jgi:anti-sigma factor RsiW